jgi:hypothetical protein
VNPSTALLLPLHVILEPWDRRYLSLYIVAAICAPSRGRTLASPVQRMIEEATTRQWILRIFYRLIALSLAVSAFLFFLWSWRWPLVGDASGIHYVVFLIQRGWAPYRQIVDQQFPGVYLMELTGMRIFGMSSVSWRIYDFTLLGFATVALFAVTRDADTKNELSRPAATNNVWFPGLFAACLFILIHGRDGMEQGGQRDFAMAVLLLGATAFLFATVRRRWMWSSVMFGLLSGVAFSIKPTVLPLSLVQLVFASYVCHRKGVSWIRHVVCAGLAFLIGPALSIAFLLREHAVSAFFAGFKDIVPFYTGLAHRPLSYILVHSVSPVLLMVYIWLVLQAFLLFTRARRVGWVDDWERTILFASAVFGLADCIMQARALPYYRYPFLGFLLPLMALDFHRVITRWSVDPKPEVWSWAKKSISALAAAGLVFGGFIVAPQSAMLIHRYHWWETDFITSLEQNLTALGGPALSRHIECIDSVSGCATVLYRMRLEPGPPVLAHTAKLFEVSILPVTPLDRILSLVSPYSGIL